MTIFIVAACLFLKTAASCYIVGQGIPSNDILSTPVIVHSASDCQVECQNNQACQFFQFLTKIEECFLKFANGRQVPLSDSIFGPKYCDKNQTCFHLDSNYMGLDYDTNSSISSVIECQLICQAESACLAITYEESTKICYKKTGRSPLTPASTVGSVCAPKYCEENYCFMDGTDFNGNDVKVLYGIFSASHCQFECQKKEDCYFFGYSVPEGRCVLKNENAMNSQLQDPTVVSGPKFCLKNSSFLKYTSVKPVTGFIKVWSKINTASSTIGCGALCNAIYFKSKKCDGFVYNKGSGACETFLLGPFSFKRFKSDEDKTELMYIRDDLNG